MSLEEVKACCQHLSSDKVTERKKAADQLKHLLYNDNIVSSLCSLSKSQRRGHFNWDQVFLSSKQFLIKESEKLEKDERSKENPTANVRSNWAKAKRTAATLPKLVLKRSCQDVPYISVDSLLEFVSSILTRERPYLLEHYAGDVIQIIHSYLLSYPQYYLHVSQEKWKEELSRVIIWIYDTNAANLDLMSVVGVIEGILKIFPQSKSTSEQFLSPSIMLRPIPNFLSRAISSPTAIKNYGLQRALLSLLCTTCSQFGTQWRRILCSVGENTINTVLKMWENKGTPTQLILLKYLNFQLVMHFPQQDGVFLEENEYAADSESWKRKLHQLYLLIFDYVSEIAANSRIGSASCSKESIPEELVTLAARLFSQINDYEAGTSLNITQIGSTQMVTQAFPFSQRSKRRRVEIGFSSICEMLKENSVQEENIPWYRIICKMLRDHKDFFSHSSRAVYLLDHLLYLLPQCKTNLVMKEIFLCLKELAEPHFFLTTDNNFEGVKRRWTRIAELTTRFVAGKQCQNIGMQILRMLILNHLTDSQTTLYRLFAKGVFTLNKDGLELLEALLITYPLPKAVKTDSLLLQGEVIEEPRICFIKLLLPLELENEKMDITNCPLKSPSQMANVLALLRLQNPLRVQRTKSPQEEKPEETELEEMLLKSLFSFKTVSKIKYTVDFSVKNLKVLKNVEDTLIKRMSHFIEERISISSEAKIQNEEIFLALSICQIIVHLWPLLGDKRLIDLVPNLRTILKHIEELLSQTSNSSPHWNVIMSIFAQFNELFATAIQISRSCKIDGRYFQSLIDAFPLSFQETCLHVVRSRELSSPHVSQPRDVSQIICSNNNKAINNSTVSDDTRDSDFDDFDGGMSPVDFEDWDTKNEDYEEKIKSNSLERATLSPKDESILLMVEWLGKMYELTLETDSSTDSEDLPFAKCMKLFFNLAENERSENHIMVFACISLLFSMKYHKDNVEDGLELLSVLSGKNATDSRYILVSLKSLKELLMINGPNLNFADKPNLIHLIKVLAEKLKKGMYGLNVSELLFENLVELTKLDPQRMWSSFTLNEDNRPSQIYNQMRSPYHNMRMKSVASIPLLFQNDKSPLPLKHQKQMFERLYQIALESLTVEGNLHQSFVPDEGSCRVASFLSCLCYVASASPAMESHALYALVSNVKVNSINVTLVIKALRSIMSTAHYPDLASYLRAHLPFLVSQWVRDRHTLEEFPFAVLECVDIETFGRDYCREIITSLFTLEEGVKEVEVLAKKLSVNALIEDNFASIMAIILPYLVASALDSGEKMKLSRSKIASATRKWKYIESTLGNEQVMSHIANDIGEVVLSLLRLGHDSGPWHEDEVVIPPPHFHFESDTVLTTLNEAHSLFFKDQSSLLGLLSERTSPIHHVLHSLFTDVFNAMARSSIQVRQALTSLDIFLQALVPLVGPQLRDMEHFTVKKLVHMLTHFITEFASEQPKMAGKCSELLHKFLLACMNMGSATQVLIPTLSSIVPRLHSLHSKPSIWNAVYKVLLPLFTSNSELLRQALSALAPFPSASRSDSQLEHLFTLQRTLIEKYEGYICLMEKVKIFMKTPAAEITCYDIQNMSDLLTEKKHEIPDLYLPSSDESPVAHAFIHKLVSIISRTHDSQKGRLGLECLGKLGPIDLNTLVFVRQPVTDEQSHLENFDEDRRMIIDIMTALNRLTFSGHLPTLEASTITLHRILSLKYCYETLKEYRDLDLILDLIPFLPCKKPKTTSRQFENLCVGDFDRSIGDNSLWNVGTDFDGWLSRLTIALIEADCGADFFNHLIPVCRVEAPFCQMVLPYVFHNLLKVDISQRRPILSRMMTHLIEGLCQEFTANKRMKVEKNHIIRSSLRLILDVINYLRTKDSKISYSNRKKPTEWDRNFWLDLDFLLLAKAAFHCGSLFSAILFAEIACDRMQEKMLTPQEKETPMNIDLQKRQLSPLQRIVTSDEGKEISALLLQVYSALGASDGVEGCGGVSLATDFVVQSTLSLHRGHNIQALCLSDAAGVTQCLLKGLRTCGLYKVLHSMNNSYDSNSKLNLDVQAECAWRLGNWNDLNDDESDSSSFNLSFWKALINLKDKDEPSFIETRDTFYQAILSFLKQNGNESTSDIYPVLSHLQIFSELSEIFNCALIKSKDEFSSVLPLLLSSWEERENFAFISSEEKEKILAARISALKNFPVVQEDSKALVQQVLFKLLMKKCELGNLSQRCRALHEARSIKVVPKQEWALKLEDVKLSVSVDNNAQAICTLDDLIQDIENTESTDADKLQGYYNALVLYGQILVKSRTRSPKLVIKNYYGKAISHMESKMGQDCELLEKCYYELASFGDYLYQEINLALSSDHSQSRKQQMNKTNQEISRIRGLMIANKIFPLKDQEQKENRRKLTLLERDFTREKKDFESKEKEAEDYLCLSLENYLKVLVSSSNYDLSIFRVVALWLENLMKEKPNNLVCGYSSRIKSHKFIPLLYQLVARLTNVEDPNKHHPSFPQTLNTILESVCRNHPHHALPVVLMLANSHLDEELRQEGSVYGRGNSKSKFRNPKNQVFVEEDRVKAAKELIERLKSIPSLIGHISELESVFMAYIALANQEDKTATQNPLMKLRNLNFTAPLTRSIPVQASACYSPPLITNWQPSVELVGGINAPLKLMFHSSDGLRSSELLKGNDDLRQDAVLEQVFSVVNKLLRNDSEASKQSLSIKTYIVVPLSQKTGLIQWCDNTTTLGDYLIAAHKKYYPNDFEASRCRNKLNMARKEATDNPAEQSLEHTLVKTLEEIFNNFHPVFRFFFYEEYPSPERWLSQRCSYTHSVATSSIAGYILGLGDRHVQNLLLDKNTAEIIHVDLGIAFENGKLLPTPEKVPFRMTQDIVDGFGVMGIEGPLRKNMETTLRVLRESKSLLITIVEVLRHDPLHQWTLSPLQIAKLRKLELQEVNSIEDSNSTSMAERAVIRVQQKLNGIQDGLVLSVSEHVSVLLQQATDISNIAQMFYGWQPYL